MARITVEDCLDKVANRFELVMVASRRARQLQTGGKDPMVPEDNDKPTVLALREIAAGLITEAVLSEPVMDQETAQMKAGLETPNIENVELTIEEAMDAVVVAEDPAESAQEETSKDEDED